MSRKIRRRVSPRWRTTMLAPNLKVKGQLWVFHKGDNDPSPSVPHGHSHLQDELTPDVDDKDVTVRRADLGRDVRSLISYAVGCMLGRYSLDKPGLAFAGGNWQEWLALQDATTYVPDKDGILPITDDEYFYDDIVTMFAAAQIRAGHHPRSAG